MAGKVMIPTRFEQIMSCLYLVDNENPNGDKLFKVKKFLQVFNSNCDRAYLPGKDTTIDKSLIPFQG